MVSLGAMARVDHRNAELELRRSLENHHKRGRAFLEGKRAGYKQRLMRAWRKSKKTMERSGV
jgi:hypothetical protein